MEPNKDNGQPAAPAAPVAPSVPTAPVAPQTPAPVAPVAPTTPTYKPEEVEKWKKDSQEYGEYKEKVEPVIETLWSDQELLKKATEAHNKRLGRVTTDPAAPTAPVAPSPVDNDTRDATINIISTDFEKKTGIHELPVEKQKEVRGKVGQMIKEMLDPKGNKTIGQVFQEVSLSKLPWYLERAYDLVTKDEQLTKAKDEGKNEILSQYQDQVGVVGGVPSSSVNVDNVALTPQERTAARRMNISEEDYLKNKKEILQNRG
jgi:hypothetical protein